MQLRPLKTVLTV